MRLLSISSWCFHWRAMLRRCAGDGRGTVRQTRGAALVAAAGHSSLRFPRASTASTNPIDAFIAAEYKAKGLVPVGKADKLTLLRRVYFDLIGLPPTIAEQDAFLADQSPDAYEKVVDRLLADEQHGVRWSRHWLDVLRYADLDGLDGSVMPAVERDLSVARLGDSGA